LGAIKNLRECDAEGAENQLETRLILLASNLSWGALFEATTAVTNPNISQKNTIAIVDLSGWAFDRIF
jgi:hypothetical protein